MQQENSEMVINISEQYPLKKTLCIYRVPVNIRGLKEEAYIPSAVGLGLYHHNINLSVMDGHKKEAVKRTLSRINLTSQQLNTELNKKNENLENEIRDCYQDRAIECSGQTFEDIFVKDACFILQYIRSYVGMDASPTDSTNSCFQNYDHHDDFHSSVQSDIWKLENQIPLFILITILQLEFNDHAKDMLAEMLQRFFLIRPFVFYFPSWGNKIQSRLKHHIEKGAHHLLDLYRRMIRDMLSYSSSESAFDFETKHGIEEREQRTDTEVKRFETSLLDVGCFYHTRVPEDDTPRAELLEKAGIKFEGGKLRFQRSLFGGSLSIPIMHVDYATEGLLRNLMAFEECQIRKRNSIPTIISQYVHLMDDLIDSENDVAVLKREKIICSKLGSDAEIAVMFNCICKSITETKYESLEITMRQARKHYNSRLKRWVSEFKKENCSKPWYVVSGVVAALILVMTAVQTVYAVKK
ncbi:hypothetical protein SUGI_0692990 [Cryptomeria japonica]|uniref:UPF0481 protein At3g47200-like n=1 Tax=Cryptomeria japonica TaxID=3369 RepID=UPI002414BED0|nr:UPF0481 protein At3g47200-like [Cryptomeria japonica]GLJ34460.1 hypothetical protein SUGI_0692990 [Cryptomeria japonica]